MGLMVMVSSSQGENQFESMCFISFPCAETGYVTLLCHSCPARQLSVPGLRLLPDPWCMEKIAGLPLDAQLKPLGDHRRYITSLGGAETLRIADEFGLKLWVLHGDVVLGQALFALQGIIWDHHPATEILSDDDTDDDTSLTAY